MLLATDEYLQFDPLDREVSPLLQAIEEWEYGPLANVMAPMKEGTYSSKLRIYSYIVNTYSQSCTECIVFEDNERSVTVVLPDKSSKTYHYVSIIPSNWYQWLDPSHPEDGSWINVRMHVSC